METENIQTIQNENQKKTKIQNFIEENKSDLDLIQCFCLASPQYVPKE